MSGVRISYSLERDCSDEVSQFIPNCFLPSLAPGTSTPDEWRKLERLESREKDASSFRAMGIPEV